MSQYQKIFLICDPSMQRSAALERAAALAKTTGASLHLCLFDHSDAIASLGLVNRHAMEQARDGYMLQRKAWVESMATELKARGVATTADVAWARPAHQEMLAQIRELQPDLVVKDVHHEPALKRALFTPTDWQLLRLCPAPLLFVRGGTRLVPKRIIAAVDPGPYDAAEAELSNQIIRAALALAIQCDAKVHLAFAFDSASAVIASMPGPAPMFSIEAYNSLMDVRRKAFEALGDLHGVPKNRRHFLEGSAGPAIAELACEHDTDVIVLGTVHRSRLDRLVMGSTAEQILERVPCSVLAIKPAALAGN